MGVTGLEGVGSASAVLDPARLAAVASSGLLDGQLTSVFDELAGLASTLLRAPLAFVTVVDDTRSHWIACAGVPEGAERSSRAEDAFCQYVIADRAPVVVSDAASHPRTRDNPSVASMGVRAWAGFPLLDRDGVPLGSFCVVDAVPRSWTAADIDTLGVLARAASAQVSLVRAVESEREARAAERRATEAETRARERLRSLTAVAFELAAAESVELLTEIVVDRGLPVLGVEAGALTLPAADGELLQVVAGELLRSTGWLTRTIPADDPFPAAHAIRTGRQVALGTRIDGIAFHAGMREVHETTGQIAWLATPLLTADRVLGSLTVSWPEEHDFLSEDVALIEAFAVQTAQALERLEAVAAQRAAADAAMSMSEALQRSMLSDPPQPSHAQIAVRYRPAAKQAQIGGDWHDAFPTSDGSTCLVIGDIAGHDRIAAATMGGVRSTLRGIAYVLADTPAGVLSALDRAMRDLDVGALATAVLARVEPGQAGAGSRTLRWSNAGHPPPLLLHPTGTAELLGTDADLLLGLDPATARSDHQVALEPGSTVLLYTDGLVERRGAGSLDDGLDWLVATVAGLARLSLEELCDALLSEVADTADDDIALLAIRTLHQDRPPAL